MRPLALPEPGVNPGGKQIPSVMHCSPGCPWPLPRSRKGALLKLTSRQPAAVWARVLGLGDGSSSSVTDTASAAVTSTTMGIRRRLAKTLLRRRRTPRRGCVTIRVSMSRSSAESSGSSTPRTGSRTRNCSITVSVDSLMVLPSAQGRSERLGGWGSSARPWRSSAGEPDGAGHERLSRCSPIPWLHPEAPGSPTPPDEAPRGRTRPALQTRTPIDHARRRVRPDPPRTLTMVLPQHVPKGGHLVARCSEERLSNDVGRDGGWGSPPHVGQHSVVIRLKHDGEALGIVQHVSPVTAVYDTEGAPITGDSTAAEQFLV